MKKIDRYTISKWSENIDGVTWCKAEDVAKLEAENEKLEYEITTTRGLWCTGRLDLIPDNIKHLFFELKPLEEE